MKRFLAIVAMLFAMTLSFGGCAEADHPRNERGGRIWTHEEVVAEGAKPGPLDSCDTCCVPGHYLPWCESETPGPTPGGGSPGGGGGYNCSVCNDYHGCQANRSFCSKTCGKVCVP